MPVNSSNRGVFLKAAAVSVLGLPALGGMIRPSLGQLHHYDATLALPEAIAQIPDLSTLSALINNTPTFYQMLENGGPYTIFAPSNEAFARLTPSQMRKLQDPNVAQAVLEYHVIDGSVKRVGLQTGSYATLLGPDVKILKQGAVFYINHALIQRQFPATNGEGHVIDKVLARGFRAMGG